jgi:hypothetical protein
LSKTKFYSLVLLFSLITVLCLGLLYLENSRLSQKVKNQSLQQSKMMKDIKINQDHDTKLKNMQNSLIISFGISKYEAKIYSIIFDELSEKYNVPWEVYPSVIRIESNFRSKLESDKGAYGLTQVLSGTAKEVSDSLGIDYNSETLKCDVLNMYIGLTYLSKGIQKNGIENGIRMYIGGPGHMRTANSSEEMRELIGTYKSTVWQEYKRMKYLYRGVCASDSLDVK